MESESLMTFAAPHQYTVANASGQNLNVANASGQITSTYNLHDLYCCCFSFIFTNTLSVPLIAVPRPVPTFPSSGVFLLSSDLCRTPSTYLKGLGAPLYIRYVLIADAAAPVLPHPTAHSDNRKPEAASTTSHIPHLATPVSQGIA